ncbi:MAG: FprA family A-type flavoprotein [Bacteroidales bacterium]|nr:FprA family A-type flavoprotein [Bacteroidales bacterium]
MYLDKKIADSIYYVGVNDRQKELFENYLPLPYGVSYNSYLIVDEKVVLIDTVDVAFADLFFRQADAVLQGRAIDYLVVDHMEPDHAGAIGLLTQRYPNIKIVGNKNTFDFLKGYFAVNPENLVEVADGGTLNIGQRTLSFHTAPMVHWPEVMVTYEPSEQILFSADAFGTFGALNGSFRDNELDLTPFWSDMRRYYACIVGKYGPQVQKAIQKLSGLPLRTVCPTHGPVWSSHFSEVLARYDQWSKYETETGLVIAYGSMYGNTQLMAEAIARGAVDSGLHHIVMHNVSKSDASYILSDIFQYKGLIIGAPTYMNGIYPLVASLLHKIEERGIKNRIFGCFGGHTWADAAVKRLNTFAETMKWENVGAVANLRGFSTETECYNLGKAVAEKLLA